MGWQIPAIQVTLQQPPCGGAGIGALRQAQHPGQQKIFGRPGKFIAHGESLTDQAAGVVLIM